MVELPADGEGLSWIARHDPTMLQLIPGLQPISIAAAAAGDQQALAYLRFAAQHHAVYPGGSALNDLDRILVKVEEAAHAGDDYKARSARQDDAQLANLIKARDDHTLSLITQAIREGELAALIWMRAICVQMRSMFLMGLTLQAARAGQLAILKHLRSQSEYWDEDTTAEALPHLDCLKWLLAADAPGAPCPHSAGILCDIARHHGLPAVQWFCEHCEHVETELCDTGILETAVELADRPMVEWLRARDVPAPWDAWVCAAAVHRGDISMLGWLRSLNPPCPWDESVTAAAASRDVKTLQWLRAQEPPCPWGPSTCAAAAKSGKLEVLMWLRDGHPPCPWDAMCAEAACSQPDVKILQWLLQQQGHWEPRTQSICVSNAAKMGHLAMLEWLSSIGALLPGDLYAAAAQAGHMHILRFLQSRKVALPANPGKIYVFPHKQLALQMFLSDIGILHESNMRKVRQARRACCMFHGLVRWCRRAVSDPSRKAHLAFDSLVKDRSGQMLLLQLSQLPPELINKIGVAAELQYEV